MSNKISIKCKELVTERGKLDDFFINVHNGIIRSITKTPDPDCNLLSVGEDSIVVPGFLDIHTHGYYGIDSMLSTEEDIHTWAKRIVEHGVTGFVPTSVSSDMESLLGFFKKIQQARSNQKSTEARILGERSEGPYISKTKNGAQNLKYVREISVHEIEEIAEMGQSTPTIIDMAPELDNFSLALSILESNGIIVSAGHTNCDYDTAAAAFTTGVRLVTHFYNAMSGCESRAPGMVTAGLLTDNVFLEIIPDLHHVSAQAIRVMVRSRGWKSMIGITDSLSIGESGKVDGSLGGLGITISNGVAMIANTSTIAGSILTPDKGFKNLVMTGATISDASMVYSGNPARLLGLTDRGDIQPGKRADLVFLDEKLNVVASMLEGNLVYDVQDNNQA